MCLNVPTRLARAAFGGLLLSATLLGQSIDTSRMALRPDWRRIGNSAVELHLASPATGPANRVWFSEDGSRLFVRTEAGRVFETKDFESWVLNQSADQPLPPPSLEWLAQPPERGAQLRRARGAGGRLYGFGRYVFRSDDGGRNWTNLTEYRNESIIGEDVRDLAVSPLDANDIVAVNRRGVWRSLDGGLSWSGLNDALPNLPVRGLLAAPADTQGVRITVESLGPVEWAPGERQAWRPAVDRRYERQSAALAAARLQLGDSVTTVATGEIYSYAGARDGRLWVSTDQGARWQPAASPARGAVVALRTVAGESRIAVAAVEANPDDAASPRVLRTTNGGLLWEDVTANLPPGKVFGVTLDSATGAIYAAAEGGVFFTTADPTAPAANWVAVGENLPAAPAVDVLLDPPGNQVYVALDGYGVYAAPAPHRFWDLRIVHAADFSFRPAAPGSLLSVLGARIVRAQAGFLDVPVLHATELESQIQIPFEAAGRSTRLALEAAMGRFNFDLPLRETSPAIFVDRDGAPLLLDGESGLVLDALNPARSRGRVQILATGLGKVQPAWPTGRAAPLQSPPVVVAPVRVFIDGAPVEVTRATLAPGYVGFYLVEIRLPAIVNYGSAELKIEAGGNESNRVRIYLEP